MNSCPTIQCTQFAVTLSTTFEEFKREYRQDIENHYKHAPPNTYNNANGRGRKSVLERRMGHVYRSATAGCRIRLEQYQQILPSAEELKKLL